MGKEKLDLQSPDLVNKNFEKIAVLFPNCITESADGKVIDFDLLKQELNHAVVEGNKERYRLEWPGKREAIVAANLPSTKTLRPVIEDSLDFDNTENIYIEGDNLEVLKLLQESYLGKIKMIYIDPPYNTGNDLVYRDNFSIDEAGYKDLSGQKDEYNKRLVVNPETAGRYHSDWLSMMYARLKLARNLLNEEGVILVSIDDNEVDNARKLCDEIFGETNFQGIFVINSTPNARDYGHIGKMHEYVLFYSKDHQLCTTNQLPVLDKNFKYSDDIGGFNIHPLYNSNEAFHSQNRPNLYFPFFVDPLKRIEKDFFEIYLEAGPGRVKVYPPKSVKNNVQFVWRWGKEKAKLNLNKEIIGYKTGDNEFRIVQKMRHTTKIIRSLLTDKKYSSRRGTAEVEELFGAKIFSFPKPLSLLHDFIIVGTNENDIVLDFFAGSGTTAHAVMAANSEELGKRKFILVQLPESLAEQGNTISDNEGKSYCNLSEFAISRLTKAAKKIKEEVSVEVDCGFRVYRLDESNMQDVYYKPQDYKQDTLELFADNVKPDRTPDDLLAQVMLDCGLPLSLKIERKEINGKQVFKIAENSLFACFDNGIDEEFAKIIAKEEPLRIVFKDSGFKDDTAKVNVKQLLKQLSPETEMKVI
ncbi:site-specific DNA-methyltransferase [Maribellus comscasis]|uniref:site-specific DNA-methyltransferase (adenine-specific) n=1 Tax=Maribellus comscasis TaxID=2681766 RepID=A0A6I6JPD4_9BACT|nr:site-specific DNA-methyltransferase [Maribellus comscasis]QGY44836.1 site-specific DNA-methyltransferase [Maribellus comscasis]